jgi:phospholipid/cholesterol/gamma-HCH transport system substrate-binding protein
VVDENRAELRDAISAFRRAAEQLDETFEEVNALTKELRGSEGTLGKLMNDDTLYDDVSDSVVMLKNMLANLEDGEGTLGKLLTDDEMQNNLDQALANIEGMTRKINEGEGTLGKLVNDDELYDNLNETMETVNEFVSRSNEFRFQVGYRGDFLADTGDVKNYYSVAIWPRLDRFYLLEVVDDPKGKESKTTTIREVTDGGGNVTYTREEETKIEDELKFSAQVGKRFNMVTLRAGLFESTGGVAADFDMLDDRLRVTVEVFDFGDGDDWVPHTKAWARLLVWDHLMFTAGFDDFLDGKGDEDYFFGAGLTFFDDDLKYILAPAASMAQ